MTIPANWRSLVPRFSWRFVTSGTERLTSSSGVVPGTPIGFQLAGFVHERTPPVVVAKSYLTCAEAEVATDNINAVTAQKDLVNKRITFTSGIAGDLPPRRLSFAHGLFFVAIKARLPIFGRAYKESVHSLVGSSRNFAASFRGFRTGAGFDWGDGNTCHPLRPTAGDRRLLAG